MKKIVLSSIIVIVIILVGWVGVFYWQNLRGDEEREVISSFEECMAAGYPVMESYPRQCRVSGGETFVEAIMIVPINRGGGKRPPPGVCRPTGCGSELCADKDSPIFSICLYRPEYVCYKSATCERQMDGECGWTMTPELQSCLDNASTQE